MNYIDLPYENEEFESEASRSYFIADVLEACAKEVVSRPQYANWEIDENGVQYDMNNSGSMRASIAIYREEDEDGGYSPLGVAIDLDPGSYESEKILYIMSAMRTRFGDVGVFYGMSPYQTVSDSNEVIAFIEWAIAEAIARIDE